MEFQRGVGLPGRVWARGEPAWIPDVVTDPNFPRAPAAAREGLHAALGFPIRLGPTVVGVIEFFSREIRQPDEDLLRMLTAIGTQIGQFIERTRGEEERARLYVETQEANRAKDDFLANVSHELRTPLTAMLGWARMLRSGRLDDEAAAHALEVIERNTEAQAQLIEDLLDISRITSGKLRLDVQPVDLVHVIEGAMNTVTPAADAKSIRMQTVLDPAAGTVAGDPDRLQQVVWNLLSNAIKFTPRGGRVQLRLERVDSRVELTVADTGRGIAPEFLPYVFDRFRQAEAASSRAHGGLGLGLAIVRHLVELHGGVVRAASEGTDRGATFTVSLPIAPMRASPSEARVHPTARTRVPFERAPNLDGVRVLVVDDEPDTRNLLARVLQQCGAIVGTAASAAEALAAFEAGPPDVLVTDIGMPGEDGYALIRKIRARAPEHGGRVPAAALTAYARVEDRMRVLSAGFQLHVPKPVEPAELATVVATLAGRTDPESASGG
jgi:signal transduction histidine kinase/ActR/RegA family two-component response regulator